MVTAEKPLLFFALPAGGFFSIGILMACFNAVGQWQRGAKAARAAGGGGTHG
jgi:Na+-translocating ferredoxin:NAD+ oxidoreductase RnfE subunit